MNMSSAVTTVLSKYATFRGRATRSEYWWWILAVFLLLFLAGLIDGALIAPMLGPEAFAPSAGQPLSMLISLALLVPGLAVAVRRLHDVDKSGWWLLLGLIPIIGALVLLFWYVQPGTQGTNRFG